MSDLLTEPGPAPAGDAPAGGRVHGRADGRERQRARGVTYGAVAVLLCAALVQVEVWPLTAFRLFSTVRSETRTVVELVAVAPDGARTPVRLDADDPVVRATAHLYPTLPDVTPDRRRAMVRAWLEAAGLDPADVATVTLERVAKVMDADALVWHEVSRAVVTEVTP